VIGLSLGDGNLSNPNGRATRLRITCDKKYPLLMKRIFNSLEKLFPKNKINIIDRDKEGCADISIYSNHLESLLGWRSNLGSKSTQNVSIPEWVKKNNKYKISCIKGLLETDGSIYLDRKYKMVIFSTIIPKLAQDFYEAVSSLGFNPHVYKTNNGVNIKYQIRLSKDVNKFLKLVKPKKN